MLHPNLNTDVLSLADFHANANAMLEQMQNTRRPLVLTHNGKSAAIVLTPADYERMMERLELMRDVSIADANVAEGKTVSNAQAKEQVLKAFV
jgi:antitoxin YefM